MRTRSKLVMTWGMALLMMLTIAACGRNNAGAPNANQAAQKNVTIRVGTKDFTENLIVGEIYALALEDAGFTVKRVPNIAGSLIHSSLISKEIELYPEYTGTGLLVNLGIPMMTDPQKVYETVKTEYDKRFQITWLNYAQANDSQGLVIRTDVAKRLGITTISDLQAHASEISFASQGEFDQREDGIAGLEKVYGKFNWKSSKVYDNALKYEVLAKGEADVAPAYTTEGQLVKTDLYQVLVDDKHFWPPYNLAPVVRNEVLSQNPEIADLLNKVSAKLDTATVTALNAKVDVEKREVDEVARAFYTSIK